MRPSKRNHRRGSLLAVIAVTFVVGVAGQTPASALLIPLLSNQASSGSGQIYDSAMLGNGRNPTGAITFRLFGPSDVLCIGTPVFTTSTAVAGNGYYESARYLPTVAGIYRWTAVYAGDANNAASLPTLCVDPAAQVVVGKRTPLLSALPSLLQPGADTASLTMAAAPSGTMAFNLYGPDSTTCAGAPVFTSTRTVTGNGTYQSAVFAPTAPGRYRWVVTYSGDANNEARVTTCSDLNGFVSKANAAIVSATPTTVARGGTVTVNWSAIGSPSITDWVGIYKAGTVDGGAVTAWKYTTGTSAGSVSLAVPWMSPAGSYEVRLMSNGTTKRLATSPPITLIW